MMGNQLVIARADSLANRRHLGDQRRAICKPVKPRDAVQRGRIKRQAVGLLIANHLEAVFDHPQPVIALAQQLGIGYSTAREYLDRIRVKYIEVGRPAPTKVDLLRRAVEDGILPGMDPDGGDAR